MAKARKPPTLEKAPALPKPIVQKDTKNKTFNIKLERLRASTLFDQVSISMEGQGCFNNPGGPTC